MSSIFLYKKIPASGCGAAGAFSHLSECEEFYTHDACPPSSIPSWQIFLSASY